MTKSGDKQASILRQFDKDTTIRLSVRKGDYLLWIATDSIFRSDSPSAWTIRDFWQMRDGDFVTVTNRQADLPPWFELHPFEVAGPAAVEMMKKINEGFEPSDPLAGPSIWRVKAGDRLVLVVTCGPAKGVREIFDMGRCALVLGESNNYELDSQTFFGAPDDDDPSPQVTDLVRIGFDQAAALGTPRTYSPEWRFGG